MQIRTIVLLLRIRKCKDKVFPKVIHLYVSYILSYLLLPVIKYFEPRFFTQTLHVDFNSIQTELYNVQHMDGKQFHSSLYIYILFKFLLEQNAFFLSFPDSCFLILGPMKLVKNLVRFLHRPTAGFGKWPKRGKKQRTEYLNFNATYFHKETSKIQTQYRFEHSGKSSIRSIPHLANLLTFNKITSTFPQLSRSWFYSVRLVQSIFILVPSVTKLTASFCMQ